MMSLKEIFARLYPPLSAEEASFRTYTNYVKSLGLFIDSNYGNPPYDRLRDAMAGSHRRANPQNLEAVRRFLRSSWSTEGIVLMQHSLPEETRRFLNHWLAVQCYYSVYSSLRSLISSLGRNPAMDHVGLLMQVASLLKDNRISIPAPWNLWCGGIDRYQTISFSNFPSTPSDVSNISRPSTGNIWDWAAKFLKTTRNWREEYFEERWKNDGRIKTKNGEPKKNYNREDWETLYGKVMYPTTLFEAMYRLRIRSNYEDVDMFLLGQNDSDARDYADSIILITQATLFVIETRVSELVGPEKFREWVGEFISGSSSLAGGLASRLGYLP